MVSPPLAETARRLLRRSRSGVLATTLPPQGYARHQPFASLVSVAPAPDLAPLMWLSALAQHSGNLTHDPSCALFLAGPPLTRNPQTAPRVTLIGRAERSDDRALLARWHALHPYAAAYAGLTDFSLWRFSIEAVHVVAGFAAAARFDAVLLLPDEAAVKLIAAEEAAILGYWNRDQAEEVDAIASAAGGARDGWRIVALDVDGFDLARMEETIRLDFAAPAQNADEVRAAFAHLADAAGEP
ncbi:MAG: HugZ family protein [Acetobacteraceae bacterium]